MNISVERYLLQSSVLAADLRGWAITGVLISP